MLEAPSPLLGGANVRFYALFRELDNVSIRRQLAGDKSLVDEVRAFHEAISCAWGVLGLLSPLCYHLLEDKQRALILVKAVEKCWDEIESVGPRYTIGMPTGERFWEAAHVLAFALARAGVPKRLLSGPLPLGGISALIQQIAN